MDTNKSEAGSEHYLKKINSHEASTMNQMEEHLGG